MVICLFCKIQVFASYFSRVEVALNSGLSTGDNPVKEVWNSSIYIVHNKDPLFCLFKWLQTICILNAILKNICPLSNFTWLAPYLHFFYCCYILPDVWIICKKYFVLVKLSLASITYLIFPITSWRQWLCLFKTYFI